MPLNPIPNKGGVTSTAQGRTLTALLVAWIVLVAYAASNSKQSSGQKRAAIAAAIVVMLILAFVGEIAPELATGFAALLLLSMVVAGPSNVFGYLTKTLPTNLIHSAGG